ncbi:MAG: hypothetical protein AMXMBFR84_09700 [Candidatus Hydrogenedentota bacterium]
MTTLLFDAAGTLLRVDPSVGHVYAAHAARYGVESDPAVLNKAFKEAYADMRTASGGVSPFHTSEQIEREWWYSLVQRVFDSANLLTGFGSAFGLFFDALFDAFAEAGPWHVYDDVRPALSRLNQLGIRCAVASNWDSRLPRLITATELAPFFRSVHTSADLGWSKPDPRFFETLVHLLGGRPGDYVHVGDEWENDISAAKSAGLEAFWINRGPKSGANPFEISSLEELPERISQV